MARATAHAFWWGGCLGGAGGYAACDPIHDFLIDERDSAVTKRHGKREAAFRPVAVDHRPAEGRQFRGVIEGNKGRGDIVIMMVHRISSAQDGIRAR